MERFSKASYRRIPKPLSNTTLEIKSGFSSSPSLWDSDDDRSDRSRSFFFFLFFFFFLGFWGFFFDFLLLTRAVHRLFHRHHPDLKRLILAPDKSTRDFSVLLDTRSLATAVTGGVLIIFRIYYSICNCFEFKQLLTGPDPQQLQS